MNGVRELRFGVRLLARSPGYTTAVIVLLALVSGANTAIFSVVNGVLLKPLPIERPQELVVVWDSDASRTLPVVELSYRTFEHWSAHSRSFSSTAVIGSSAWPAILQGRGAPVRLASSGVSASFFSTLGVAPLLGRTFLPEDDQPNAAPVAILSHGVWMQYFGGDPGVIGSSVQVDTTRTIVGVMPQDFDFPRGTSYWLPVVPLLAAALPDLGALDGVGVLFVIGRLRSGVTPAMVADDLEGLADAGGATPAPRRFGTAVVVTPFFDYLLGPIRQGLWTLWAAVGLLLLIACANVSGLMLGRASIRSREHAVRAALGATRLAIGRLWLVEALLLALAGGALGLTAAGWMSRAIVALAPPDVPRLAHVSIEPRVAVFTMVVVLITAALCGAGSARQAGAGNLVETLNEAAYGTPGRRRQRSRAALLAVQIALSIVLLVSAGLVVRSFHGLRQLDVGFDPADVVTMFAGPQSNEQMHALLERVEALPGVTAAGAIYLRPLELGPIGQETSALLEEQTEASARDNPTLNFQVATPRYFRTLRIRLVAGRLFSDRDRAGAGPVALVGETAARRLWPGENPVGKRLLLRGQKDWRTVVGVVADVHYRGLGDVRLDVYEPALQSASSASYVAIRTAENPLALVSSVEAEARRLDPGLVVDSITTLDATMARAVAPWRFTSWLLGLLASAAFLLTTIGLLGVVGLEVSNRRHELAIRAALGAERKHLTRSVLMPVVWPGVIGAVAGVLGAVFTTRAIRSLLFGVHPIDPVTWVVVLVMIGSIAGVAAYVQARRAATVDPLMLIRRV